MTVIRAVNAVTKLVEQVEEEWKQQPVGQKAQGVERGYRGGAPAVNPLIADQMQHIAVQQLQHGNPVPGCTETPPVDEEKLTIEHIASQLEARRQWEAVSSSSQHSLIGLYKEGAGSMSAALAGKGPGPVDGGSTFYSDSARPYRTQAEQGMELELEYDEHSLDELEQWFLEESIELTQDQNKEEDKENARHCKVCYCT
ncbi:unnamed protein product [Sphagnum balticum]